MKFKEFDDWCNERICDGYWGSKEATTCVDMCRVFLAIPKWKREKIWSNFHYREYLEQIVKETNAIIEKTKKDTVF